MTRLDEVVARLEELFAAVEAFDEPMRSIVLELLDGVDTLHRLAIEDWARATGASELVRVADEEASVRWLLDAYGVLPEGRGASGDGSADESADDSRGESAAREVPVMLRPTRKA